jgi:hypothetical protein
MSREACRLGWRPRKNYVDFATMLLKRSAFVL